MTYLLSNNLKYNLKLQDSLAKNKIKNIIYCGINHEIKNKGMIKMCCCCCKNSCGRSRCNNSISGIFTQNIPVTMAYRFAPISIGSSIESSEII